MAATKTKIRMKKTKQSFTCQLCGAVHNSPQGISAHVRHHHGEQFSNGIIDNKGRFTEAYRNAHPPDTKGKITAVEHPPKAKDTIDAMRYAGEIEKMCLSPESPSFKLLPRWIQDAWHREHVKPGPIDAVNTARPWYHQVVDDFEGACRGSETLRIINETDKEQKVGMAEKWDNAIDITFQRYRNKLIRVLQLLDEKRIAAERYERELLS